VRRTVAGLVGAVVAAVACSSSPSDNATTGPPRTAACPAGSERQVVVAAHERPEDLHPYREGPRIAGWINQGLFEGLWGIDGNHEFVPELLAAEPTFETHSDKSVTVHMVLRDGLTWSDGTPLTSQHVEDTWHLIMERADGAFVLDFGPRSGHELIHPDSWKHEEDGRTFSFLLVEPFGGIRNLFKLVLPTHVLDSAAAANLALATGRAGIEVLPSSGPLLLERFSDSDTILLTRNERYHGSSIPDAVNAGVACATGVELRFPGSSAAMAEQLLEGAVDIVVAPSDRALAELLAARPDVNVASVNSLAVEHWGFNLRNPHLADPAVRRAIATAIDKQAVIDGVYGPIHGEAAPPPLGSFFLMPTQAGYQDHQPELGLGDDATARSILANAGYTETPEGTWAHADRGLLALEVSTTPDPVRQAQFELIRRGLEDAGIVVTLVEDPDALEEVVFSEASLLCSREGRSGVEGDLDGDGEAATSDCGLWDIAQFTWTFGSPWPGGQVAQFTTGSTQNPYGVADESIDQLTTTCVAEMDLVAASGCFNQLDAQLVGDSGELGIVMVPIAQRSTFVAWRDATLVSVPQASDADGAGLFARAAEIIASGGGASTTPST